MNRLTTVEVSQSEMPELSLLGNALAVTMGTSVLVAIHHHYRKQRQPNARVQDYLFGFCSQLQLLPAQSAAHFRRVNHAYLQAIAAGQHAYHNYIDDSDAQTNTSDFAAAHTPTVLTRHVKWVSGVASMPQFAKPTHDTDNDSDFGVVGIAADRQIVWQTTLPERVHDIVVQPINGQNSECGDKKKKPQQRDVVVMGRRPSERFWVLDTANGEVKHAIQAAENRHFYGHACYGLEGTLLYVTENDTANLVGKIGVYDVYQQYKKVAEFDAYGIGPHELIMHPDGDTLIVANGGIKTEKASREELNLDTMQPALVYLNRHDGLLLEQVTPEHNQMSIRHLAVHNEGTVVVGIQFQGDKHINVPLVLTHQRGDHELKPLLIPNNQWQRFHHYIASVAVDSEHNLLCATSPFGGCAAVFDLNTRELIESIAIPDCAGVSVLTGKTEHHDKKSGFIISDGLGNLTTLNILNSVTDDEKPNALQRVVKNSQTHDMSFDNHLQVL